MCLSEWPKGNLMLTTDAGKYLPALRCLLAIQQLEPEHPKSHELSCRLRRALDTLPEPLPEKVQSIIKETFLSKVPTKSVQETNEEYLSAHKTSSPHVQAVALVRHALKPKDEEVKNQSAKDLEATLDSDQTTLQDALAGLRALECVGASKEARDPYAKKAAGRWAEADVFST